MTKELFTKILDSTCKGEALYYTKDMEVIKSIYALRKNNWFDDEVEKWDTYVDTMYELYMEGK